MSELIAHEVEVAAIDGRSRDQTNHLVQGDTAVDHIVLVAFLEVPVHIGIDEAEDDGLVAHKSLVVALAVRDGLLVGTTVLHLPEDAAGLPVLVLQLLDGLNPIVGHIHRHAIVEAKAAVLELGSEARHARHLLSDGDGIGILLVNQAVGQREIANGIVVLVTIEVVAIAAKSLAQSVAIVEHRRHTIEAEAVEVELLQPVFAVREEEMDYLILTVVEAQTIPGGMLMHASCVEELIRIASQVS